MKILAVSLIALLIPYLVHTEGFAAAKHWTRVNTMIVGVHQFQSQMPGDTGPVVTTVEVTYQSCAILTAAQFEINATLAEGGKGYPMLSANVLQLEDGCLNPVHHSVEVETQSIPLFQKVTVQGEDGTVETLDVSHFIVD